MTLDEDRKVYGQVVAKYRKDAYYVTILDRVYGKDDSPPLDVAVDSDVVLLALTLDAKFVAGHWRIIGRSAVDDNVPLPAYKEAVATPQNIQVVDYSGTSRRAATPGEARELPNRTVVAPVRVEKVLRALHGLEPWRDDYDALRPNPLLTSKRLFAGRAG